MSKYYCNLCELTHHGQKNGASCPECGRKYCLDSIKESIGAGKTDCPYCDTPYEWFPEIPIALKKEIRQIPEPTLEKTTEIEKEETKYIETFEPKQRIGIPLRPTVSYADRIRQYALEKFINPARSQGKTEVSFCARDIHNGLGFTSRYPNVIQAIEGQKFRKMARIQRMEKVAPPTVESGLSSTICWNIKLDVG